MSLKPICVKCARFYRPLKNGVYFREGMPTVDRPGRGLAYDEQWQDYKLWSGDMWRCEGCDATIIVGVGAHPVIEHYMPKFREWVQATNATFRVNDC